MEKQKQNRNNTTQYKNNKAKNVLSTINVIAKNMIIKQT